jgi:hypothetical protein
MTPGLLRSISVVLAAPGPVSYALFSFVVSDSLVANPPTPVTTAPLDAFEGGGPQAAQGRVFANVTIPPNAVYPYVLEVNDTTFGDVVFGAGFYLTVAGPVVQTFNASSAQSPQSRGSTVWTASPCGSECIFTVLVSNVALNMAYTLNVQLPTRGTALVTIPAATLPVFSPTGQLFVLNTVTRSPAHTRRCEARRCNARLRPCGATLAHAAAGMSRVCV